jgi:hypothetical protein
MRWFDSNYLHKNKSGTTQSQRFLDIKEEGKWMTPSYHWRVALEAEKSRLLIWLRNHIVGSNPTSPSSEKTLLETRKKKTEENGKETDQHTHNP